MALFRVSLRLARAPSTTTLYKWSNTFYYDVDTVSNAAAAGLGFWEDALRDAARSDVFLYEVYASDLTPGTDVFTTLTPGGAVAEGTITPGSSDKYHRDICLAVNMHVSESRPSRKYWRPGLQEEDFNASGLFSNTGLSDAIATAFGTLLTTYTGLRDVDGQEFTGNVTIKQSTRRIRKSNLIDLPLPPA